MLQDSAALRAEWTDALLGKDNLLVSVMPSLTVFKYYRTTIAVVLLCTLWNTKKPRKNMGTSFLHLLLWFWGKIRRILWNGLSIYIFKLAISISYELNFLDEEYVRFYWNLLSSWVKSNYKEKENSLKCAMFIMYSLN